MLIYMDYTNTIILKILISLGLAFTEGDHGQENVYDLLYVYKIYLTHGQC